ncbi:hypothetical protein NIE88_18990 [Sporolactobacillus shoreicorticis]|uniref:YopX protein domain-containing protein n=1 Tax=Sporolactobacillus shoreicorticis TaxID=1923877 RepID=A0ABW5S6F0_9BACL|nr:hypothetical protein [Sporolactobacillus shoreicorticis]MCO7127837.1 hypothetical protein [Sporolactobacillus shoreicorticis]
MNKKYQLFVRTLNHNIKGKTMYFNDLSQLMYKEYGFDTTIKDGFELVDNYIPKVGEECYFCWRTLKDKYETIDAIIITFFILNLDDPDNPKIKINRIYAD